MLHEAIFHATRNATMTNKKPFKLQRVCYTLATSFATCNAYNRDLKIYDADVDENVTSKYNVALS